MRTSVEISDGLLKRARAVMSKRGVTLRALIEDGLQRVLSEDAPRPFTLRDASFKGVPGFAPGAGEQDVQQVIRDLNERVFKT